MTLDPRPASPGTDVPSRNRSAPLELCCSSYSTGHNPPGAPAIPSLPARSHDHGHLRVAYDARGHATEQHPSHRAVAAGPAHEQVAVVVGEVRQRVDDRTR